MKIKNVKAIEINDSRGTPTIRTFVFLDNGFWASSSVASGASTGSHEAVELRDNDGKRYFGKGVLTAIYNVNKTLKEEIVNRDADPKKIDELMIELDATENKSRFGANAILSVSQALIRAVALSYGIPLWQFISEYYFEKKPAFPKIMFNVVNGGKHANWNFDIQEFIVIPSCEKPSESVRIGSEIYHSILKNLKENRLSTLVGDEGGFSPALKSNEEVFRLIVESANAIGYENGGDYRFAIDAAASEFYHDGKYILKKDNQEINGNSLASYYIDLVKKYRISSIEDPFYEDDWKNWTMFLQKTGKDVLVIGDDLFCTKCSRMKTGFEKKATNAVLIKPNQIGSIKETIEAIKLGQEYGWKIVISHRSGETEDPFIADLSYASRADYIKTGAPARSDRVSKHNRLIEIENHL